MPLKSQAPVQQRDNGHNRHATENKNRNIRQSKHDTLLICSMLTYNTIGIVSGGRQRYRSGKPMKKTTRDFRQVTGWQETHAGSDCATDLMES